MPRRQSALVDTRVIYCGDCLEKLKRMPDACVDLIYIDPPFNSNQNYEVFWGDKRERRHFEDRHASTQAYIEFMRPRCVELARVLKPTGSLYYHCDWHASHYIKVTLDQILGENNFKNEVIWKRATAKTQSHNCFPNNHDSLLFYGGGGRTTFNRQFYPHSDERIQKHFSSSESGRKFSLSDLTGDGTRNGETGKPWRGFDPNSIQRHWGRPPSELDKLDEQGLIYWPKKPGGWPRMKRFLDELKGVQIDTVWTDIPPLNATAAERVGYPTQKPLPLLERIIRTSSNEGDVVLDAFCGCGTAITAAERLGRNWIGIDISPKACHVMAKRIRDVCHIEWDETLWRANRGFAVFGLPRSEENLKTIPHDEFEEWAVIALHGQPNKSKVRDMGIDGRIYPVSDLIEKNQKMRQKYLSFVDVWYPVQVKQTAKVGRQEIDKFEAVMIREDRDIGFFVGFEFTKDAEIEVRAFERKSGRRIILRTVRDLLAEAAA